MTRTVDPDKLLHRVDTAWAKLWAAQARLDDAHMAIRSSGVDWSVKDILTHVARWDSVCAKVVRAQVAHTLKPGDLRQYQDDNALNAQWIRADQGLTVRQARSRCQSAHRRLRLLLGQLSAEQWAERRVHSWALDATVGHYPGHTKDILAASKS